MKIIDWIDENAMSITALCGIFLFLCIAFTFMITTFPSIPIEQCVRCCP